MVTAEYYFMNIFLQYTVVLLLVTFWSCMTAGEVTLVNRYVTDIFRVGKDGCTRNSDCPDQATCQSDSGLCLCSDSQPNFLYFNRSSSADYQCVTSTSIRAGLGECL